MGDDYQTCNANLPKATVPFTPSYFNTNCYT